MSINTWYVGYVLIDKNDREAYVASTRDVFGAVDLVESMGYERPIKVWLDSKKCADGEPPVYTFEPESLLIEFVVE